MKSKVVLVTGASSGIGLAVAKKLVADGHKVFGTSRHVLAGDDSYGFEFIRMDVTKEDSVAEGVAYLLATAGRLDAVVNNAGLGMVGPVESTTHQEALEIFSTNVFGVLNVCRACIPHLRASGDGYIINITSLAGQMGLPFRGIYSASKFAVEGFTESLSAEVMQFGIKVCIIEPGDFRTNINQTRRVTSRVHESYVNQSKDILRQVTEEVAKAPTPEAIGIRVASILNDPHPFLRYRVANLRQRFSLTLMRILPGRWFERLVMKHYKLK